MFRKIIHTNFLSLFLIISYLFNFQLSPQTQSSKTWVGEIDGVHTWITVLARDRQFTLEQISSPEWKDWGNTETDAYLFSFDQPENVRLILAFEKLVDSDFLCAKIFLNNYGKQAIDYQIIDGELNVFSNNGYPYLTVYPQNGGWFVDGKPNYNLEILVDGIGEDHILKDELITDSIIDQIITVRSNGNDQAEWQVNLLVNDPHPSWGYPRFDARKRFQPKVNIKSTETGIMDDFPYLDIANKGQNLFTEDVYPLYFDLRTYEFRLGNFVGFQDGGIWAVNSISFPPDINFEAPFVFYNLDDTDRFAEMAIRSEYFPGTSELSYLAKYQFTTNNIRFSWKTTDNTLWQFGINVQGLAEFTDNVSLGSFDVKSIAPEKFPGWVIDNNWPVISFIESIDGYSGSEGIYFYGGINSEIWPWIVGEESKKPGYFENPYFPTTSELTDLSGASIPIDFRAEYTWGLGRNPLLYISAIDKRIHLLNAMGGSWNLSENQIIRYENLDGDEFIDTWVLKDVFEWQDEENERLPLNSSVREALYHFTDYVIFSSSDKVIILNENISNKISIIKPPTDKATYEDFKDNVLIIEQDEKDPLNMISWLDEFSSNRVILTGANASNIQHIENGFSFVLNISENYEIYESSKNPFSQLSPGKYFIQNINGKWAIRDLAPADITFKEKFLIINRISERANQLIKVSVKLENVGDECSDLIIAELWVNKVGQLPIQVTSKELTLESHQTEEISFVWEPESAGNYSIEIHLRGKEIKEDARLTGELAVLSSADPQLTHTLHLTKPSSIFLLSTLLLNISISAILLVRLINKISTGK